MSSINPLGRTINLGYSTTTSNTRHSVRNCSGYLIVTTGATSGNTTVQEANAASGGTIQNLAAITEYWTLNNGVWTRVTQAAAATFTSATGGLAAAFIPQGALSDGFTHLAASHASGNIIMIAADLDVQRRPTNLPDIRA